MECTNLVFLGQKAIIFKKIIDLFPKTRCAVKYYRVGGVPTHEFIYVQKKAKVFLKITPQYSGLFLNA